jgi:branched-chain amino acid transport system ATP-binding protein
MSDALLRLEGVEVVYHRVITAIQGVSMEVPRGGIVALLGTNGAGKTTTLRAISGFLGADNAQVVGGRVVFLGDSVTGRPPHEMARRGLVLVPERDKVFETLTVQENLKALVRGRPAARDTARPLVTLEQVFHYFPVLAERGRQLAGYLSGGERQMLALATALLCRPVVLLIDELSLGLAPSVVGQLLEIVRALRDQGTTIILVEQSVNLALTIAETAYFMEKGEIRFHGPTAELLERPDDAHAEARRARQRHGRHRTRARRSHRRAAQGGGIALQAAGERRVGSRSAGRRRFVGRWRGRRRRREWRSAGRRDRRGGRGRG